MRLDRLRAFYRRIVPEPMRRAVRNRLTGTARPYSGGFFDSLDADQGESYSVIAESLVTHFHPRSVIDLGCGTGALLEELQRRGVAECAGVEYAEVGCRRARKRGLVVRQGDLSRPFGIDGAFDLAICMEVAEHLPPQAADQLVHNLAAGPPRLIFSAATPGQGGHHHLNEQPHQYWIEKLSREGMRLDPEATSVLRAQWQRDAVASWYARNVMVFRRTRTEQA